VNTGNSGRSTARCGVAACPGINGFSIRSWLPDGRNLVTLLDAATYATELPKEESDTAEWQAAIESLMLVAEHDGPTKFARIGVMRALNRHVIHRGKTSIGDAASWRGIDEAALGGLFV